MGKRVLIVEEDTRVRNFLKSILERDPYKHQVLEFTNAEMAWLYLRTGEPVDVVITDHNLSQGQMSGLALLKQIRDSSSMNQIQVAMVSSEAMFEGEENTELKKKVEDLKGQLFPKPYNIFELLSVLDLMG